MKRKVFNSTILVRDFTSDFSPREFRVQRLTTGNMTASCLEAALGDRLGDITRLLFQSRWIPLSPRSPAGNSHIAVTIVLLRIYVTVGFASQEGNSTRTIPVFQFIIVVSPYRVILRIYRCGVEFARLFQTCSVWPVMSVTTAWNFGQLEGLGGLTNVPV